jgi:hypothetical protein
MRDEDMSEKCPASEAEWYVTVTYGRTLCEDHGDRCRLATCERLYGTEMGDNDAYFKGFRPTLADRDAMVPDGHYRLASKVIPTQA